MFTCASCWDEAPETSAVTVGSDSLCEECFTNGIKAQFLDAIKDETKYPVRYGTEDLNIQDYKRFFTDSFLKNWSTKEKEYKTPMQERLYCNRVIFVIPADHEFAPGSSTVASKQACGSFLGDKRGCLSDVTFCSGCTGPVCSKCSEPLNGAKVHKCEKSQEDDPFGEMTRGVDYQICPNESCKMKMMLWDGCNSLRCQICRTQLCFICGKQPAADHFSKGKCPRFGKLGDERAIHDTRGPAQNHFDDIFQLGNGAPFHTPGQDTGSLEERLVDTLIMHLEEIHERIFTFPIPRSPDVNPVHDLTHSITEQLQRFRITFADPQRSFRGIGRFQETDRAITTTVARVGEDGFQLFPGLDLVIASYRLVWADALTEDSMNNTIRQISQLADDLA